MLDMDYELVSCRIIEWLKSIHLIIRFTWLTGLYKVFQENVIPT